ncbi:endonuclease [Oceanobacillus zhaokaii]|uniref:Endonuclease n=1 Tax=Oceanobacillus zhaokaii TaxID=2052660 RepID=A0A345PLF5_9BACI|nr:endonuclease III domain-containing protein [Oceanobacillus zhaokaii]AXI10835.1 endonuclease [Oceanobacillus zhaokaii]
MQPAYKLIYNKLFEYYGPQSWWPAETPFEMMIGSILVQNTNWRNVDKALIKLAPYFEPAIIDYLPIEDLAQLIRSSGFYNIKAKRIKAFMEWFRKYDYNVERIKNMDKIELRKELLSIHGIGQETADVMLVYAFEKPVFVVDAYARRIFYRIGHDMPASYDSFRKLLEKELPNKLTLYNEFHALLVEHAKQYCRSKPICENCPLLDICDRRRE